MKMIIDIPEGMLEAIKDGYWSGSHKLELAIRNGTPYEERPKGEWLYEYDDFYHCSRCGHVICTEWDNLSLNKDFPFCHCGADMRKGDES